MTGKTISVQHGRLDQKKKIAKIGFSFGDFAIRKFDLDAIYRPIAAMCCGPVPQHPPMIVAPASIQCFANAA